MQTPTVNPCVRCGKPRITVKSWSEKVGTAKIKYTLTECPDPDCQKLVDAANAEREEKRLVHLHKSHLKKGFHR